MELKEFLDSIPVGQRRPRFEALAEAMLSLNRPVMIVETGCMRKSPSNEGPEIDGCSTLVWDYVAQNSGGKCVTIDISKENCEYTKERVGNATQVVCGDSVALLSTINYMSEKIDFLYLDSMDWQGTITNRGLSSLHHAAELCAAWQWLAHDALIAIDDCQGPYEGKHCIVKHFFDSIGVKPLTDDYIHVWRKPYVEGIKL